MKKIKDLAVKVFKSHYWKLKPLSDLPNDFKKSPLNPTTGS